MGKVINFKRAGKKITRRKKEQEAGQRRVLFGQKKSVKIRLKKEKKTFETNLDNHKTDEPGD